MKYETVEVKAKDLKTGDIHVATGSVYHEERVFVVRRIPSTVTVAITVPREAAQSFLGMPEQGPWLTEPFAALDAAFREALQ